MKRNKIVVSSCLLGNPVRYNGSDKKNSYISNSLLKWFDLIPVCPEQSCGLSTPREPMNLYRIGSELLLKGGSSSDNYTDQLNSWMADNIDEVIDNDIVGYILKSKSPSCGINNTNIYDKGGRLIIKNGSGLFSLYLEKQLSFVPMVSDTALDTEEGRDSFILSVFLLREWRKVIDSPETFADFHRINRYLLLSINAYYYHGLSIIFRSKWGLSRKIAYYGKVLLKISQKRRSHYTVFTVLKKIFIAIKYDLNREDRYELLHIIELYKRGLTPLLQPISLFNHHINRLDRKDLLEQSFLKSEPVQWNLLYHP